MLYPEPQPTVLTLENEYGVYSITLKRPEPTLQYLMEYGVAPLMLAVGYSPATVKEWFDE